MARRTTSAKRNTPGVTVTWFGHSAFLFESTRGKRILIDPWLDNPRAPEGAWDVTDIHVVLVTHGHSDHLGNCVEIAKRTGARVIAIHEVSLYLKDCGVASLTGMNKGGTLDLGGISVTMTDARHSSSIDASEEVKTGGEAAGYVVKFENGFSVYHAGDTAVFGDMKLIAQLYKPDAVFLPVGDLFTMGPREAALACAFLKPRVAIVGMHYGTFPPLAGTPAELKRLLPAAMRKQVRVLEPGIPTVL